MGPVLPRRLRPGPDDVWVVGGNPEGDGLVLHWDGNAWTEGAPLSEPVYRLDDVWGSSGSDVYAVGPRTLLRYDGSSWRRVPGLEGRRVWGTSREDVYLLQDTRLVHGKP